ncbi:MAG TPA: FAD-binding oxidoreductase [Tepidisphaeraceae bacterium]|nr:FAD-binding oxidoreductase [Tepidisphaeraceae bacterium]
MPRSRLMELSGWGNVPRQAAQVFRPEKVAEARAVVASPPAGTLLARGLGRSYGDAALNENGNILLDTRLSRFLAFDPAAGVLECEAGVSLEDILHTFVPRGFFPPVTPGTKFVTIGGAIAADVHGKNHHRDGSIAEFIDGLDLLTATGEVLPCSREQNSDIFFATLGGMGLTGVILQARIRLRKIESAYIAVDYQQAPNLDAALAAFASGDEQYQYSVAWIDCLSRGASLGRSVLIRGNHATAGELPPGLANGPLNATLRHKRSVHFNLPNFALSPLTVRLFNNRFYARHKDGRKYVDYDEFFYPLDSLLHWNRIYGKRGFFQYQAVFPATKDGGCLRKLLQRLSTSGRASFLAVLKTMGKSSGGLLSFPMPGHTLALDIPNGGPTTVALLRELDAIVMDHGGRVYLAKDACMTAESFQRMYPNVGQFDEIKNRLDPQGVFSSSQARRLGIGEGVMA